ncbi:hypothetical protein Ocin01_19697, partial [Orchesella cincta]
MTQLPEREEFENRFLDVVSKIDDIIDEKTPDPQSTAPRLNKQLFQSQATPTGFAYFSWQGDAATLVKTLTICDANYDEAWQILTERYDNKREIIHSLLKRLFNQQHLTSESSQGLQQLLDTTKECLRTLTVLKRPVEHWDDVIVHFILERMDPETLNNKCPLCKSEHNLFKCQIFLSIPLNEKHEIVKKFNLCFNCLRSDHRINDCRSQSKCRTCSRKHHSLLHRENAFNTNSTAHYNPNDGAPPANETSGTSSSNPNFQWIRRWIKDKCSFSNSNRQRNGQRRNLHPVRVLLDTGSEASFISEKCVLGLGLQRRRSEVVVTGISSSSGGNKGELTSSIPSELSANSRWPHVKGLQLADPDFNVPGNIDILLGAEYVSLLMCEGRKFGPPNTPVAENTIFGWVLLGRVATKGQESVRNHMF